MCHLAIRLAALGMFTPVIITTYAADRTQSLILHIVFAILWASMFFKTWKAAEMKGARRVFDRLYQNRAMQGQDGKTE